MYRFVRIARAALIASAVAASNAAVARAQSSAPDADASAIFTRRILPILEAPRPSSCTECHLSGVDLKDYIDRDQAKMFASLKAAGLIDVERPDDSKLLKFIARKSPQPSLISQRVKDEEYAAFRTWIAAAVADPKLRDAAPGAKPLGPQLPPEVIRHARRDRVLASFIDYVWSDVGRCAACHSPEKNRAQVKKHGDYISWITPNDPAATLRHLVEHELIDVAAPEKSLLLLKPTNQVKHGGGVKMVVGDKGYKQFRRFLDDYAATVNGTYRKPGELPGPREETSQVTDAWFRITDLPPSCDDHLLQVDLYREDRSSPTGWSSFRWATGDRLVGKGAWQQHLEVTAPRATLRAAELAQAPRLPPGRYLAKIYVDREDRLSRDFRQVFGETDLLGTLVVESKWPEGYGRMTVVSFQNGVK